MGDGEFNLNKKKTGLHLLMLNFEKRKIIKLEDVTQLLEDLKLPEISEETLLQEIKESGGNEDGFNSLMGFFT